LLLSLRLWHYFHMQKPEKLTRTFQGLNPLDAPALYGRHFGGQDVVTLRNSAGRAARYETLSSLSDAASGFRADVVLDRASGHAVILYKGMDVPFTDEGSGRLAFLRDGFAAVQAAVSGGPNMQTPFADRVYLETKANPAVKSIEAVGFSLGTLHANYVAAKYGIRATVLSDLGIGDKGLTDIFNSKAGAEKARRRLSRDVTVLDMELDLIPRLFAAGPHRGRVIALDAGAPDLSGLSHHVSAYSRKARELLAKIA
jgi:hypothetical protein